MLTELLKTVDECPTFGRPLAFAGQLASHLPPSSLHADQMIARGAELAPYDPQACIAAGRLAALAGDRARAGRMLRRAIAIGDAKKDAIDVFINILGDPDAAEAVAQGDVDALDALTAQLASKPATGDVLQRVDAERNALLDRQAADPFASAATLDRVAARCIARGERDRAIALLTRAATLDYASADRRMLLGRLLADSGRYADAVTQAKIALRLRQDDPAIKQQIEAWTRASPPPPPPPQSPPK